MNERMSRLAFFQLLGLGAAAGALGYWQLVRGPELVARSDNPRRLDEQWRTVRGQMFDRKGRPLAVTEVAPDGYVRRSYPKATLGSTLGFINTSQGKTGLEAAYDDHLSGRIGLDAVSTFQRRLLNRPFVGSDLHLTLDLDLQNAAEQALASGPQTPGAAVVLDPRTGAVRALATTPTFDPNRLTFDATVNDWTEEARKISAYAAELAEDPAGPLINRATQGQYPPGSTFKTVTLAAALARGAAKPGDRFKYGLKPPDAKHRAAWHSNQFVSCQNHPQAAEFDLAHAYAYSCNVAFSDLGTKIGTDAYLEVARGFGLDSAPPFPIPVEVSRLQEHADFFTGDERFYAIASTAMGQGELSVTPLQMALIAAAMVGNGQVLQPYLVEQIRRPDGTVVMQQRPQVWVPGVNSQTAAQVRDMMVTSVNEGWASGANITGQKIGGKTGTAELGGDAIEPHAWYIGFATADNPRVAIALIKERSGASSAVASPAAKILFEAALRLAD